MAFYSKRKNSIKTSKIITLSNHSVVSLNYRFCLDPDLISNELRSSERKISKNNSSHIYKRLQSEGPDSEGSPRGPGLAKENQKGWSPARRAETGSIVFHHLCNNPDPEARINSRWLRSDKRTEIVATLKKEHDINNDLVN